MSTSRTDAATRLGWALQRYWAPALVVVVVFAVLGYLGSRGTAVEAVYETQALIAAADLQIRPEQLPRTASIMFRSGPVAQGTAAALGLQGDPGDLVPEVIELEPVEDTVLLQIQARDPSPERAALLADTAAGVMLDELNVLGEGFGTFVLVAPATVPQDPVPVPGNTLARVLAIMAGLLFSGGMIGLVIALRRPVLTASEAAELSGASLIGVLPMPARGPLPSVQLVPGLSAAIKQVLPTRLGIAVFVSVRGGDAQRSQVAMLFALGLARMGPVVFVPSPGGPAPEPGTRNLAIADHARGIARLDDLPVVIDGPSAATMDVPQFLPSESRVVLVVAEGASENAVHDAASQFLTDELAGVIFVPRRGRSSSESPPDDR